MDTYIGDFSLITKLIMIIIIVYSIGIVIATLMLFQKLPMECSLRSVRNWLIFELALAASVFGVTMTYILNNNYVTENLFTSYNSIMFVCGLILFFLILITMSNFAAVSAMKKDDDPACNEQKQVDKMLYAMGGASVFLALPVAGFMIYFTYYIYNLGKSNTNKPSGIKPLNRPWGQVQRQEQIQEPPRLPPRQAGKGLIGGIGTRRQKPENRFADYAKQMLGNPAPKKRMGSV